MARLSKKQRDALALMKDGDIRADLMEIHPKTWESIRDHGLATIDRKSGGLRWAFLTDAGRAALSRKDQAG